MVSFRFSKSNKFGSDDGHPQKKEYTIDELARASDSTVRKVRAYQDKGLLAPPERRGRVGIYNEDHLGRLRLINQLLGRGYSLGNIQELLRALESGSDLRQLLGLANAISSPWSDEIPRYFNAVSLANVFGLKPNALKLAIAMGLLEPEGLRYKAANPKILMAGAEMAKLGMPIEELLELIGTLRGSIEAMCDNAVKQFVRELDKYGEGLPPAEEVPRLSNMVWQIRPLAMMAIESEVSRALEKSANKFMGDRVAKIIEHIMQHVPDMSQPDVKAWLDAASHPASEPPSVESTQNPDNPQ